jgi:hypothetical protein
MAIKVFEKVQKFIIYMAFFKNCSYNDYIWIILRNKKTKKGLPPNGERPLNGYLISDYCCAGASVSVGQYGFWYIGL